LTGLLKREEREGLASPGQRYTYVSLSQAWERVVLLCSAWTQHVAFRRRAIHYWKGAESAKRCWSSGTQVGGAWKCSQPQRFHQADHWLGCKRGWCMDLAPWAHKWRIGSSIASGNKLYS